ncbi:hypothetical protein [Legionella hackeliae]|uniref:Uncharacterized protein n=1 Tax=Legionella hackeliae TaxID=449 RepID=A0A0A8UW15_LEGHA|nr:hypothetical protein [Legionella hackeliae]KTD09991.1 hypothetical protein Lhac_2359 [Legionella hackeliae]CEK11706.1 conserved protein of unknown function [Legionella hackeliae]STX48475.1 Uncharacterised protein [Legionella hackeliae]
MPRNLRPKAHNKNSPYDKENVYQKKYYREKRLKLFEVHKKKEQQMIDEYIQNHDNLPPTGTAREMGYSSYVFTGVDLVTNSSMIDVQKSTDTTFILSRLQENAPKLPVSCIASTEHVVCMQDQVEDFQLESLPESKKEVKYQLLIRSNSNIQPTDIEKATLIAVICLDDDILTAEDVVVTYDQTRKLYVVELGTQLADIQQVIRNLQAHPQFQIENCKFEDVGLYQGICLLKPDASNPIHAMANIAQGMSDDGQPVKFFLERDAGKTSGTARYQDNKWTFNLFKSLPTMFQETGYPLDSIAVKILKNQ